MKILFVCAFPLTKNALQAGHRLAFEYISEIALTAEVDVVLLLKNGQVVNNDLQEIPNVNVLFVKYFSITDVIWNFLSKGSISSFYTRYSKSIEKKLCELIENKKYDVVRLEFSQVSYYSLALRKRFNDQIRIEIAIYDIQLQLGLRQKTSYRSLFIKSNYMLEEQTFKNADKIWTVSQKDADFLNLVYGKNLVTQPLKISLSPFVNDVKRTDDTIVKNTLIFWGAMNRPENEDSIINFITNVFNPIAGELKLTLFVVGANPSKKLLSYASERIIITGFLDTPKAYFERAELGVVPLLFGAGIKLKTMEMLEVGLPVIATYIGAEGIIPKNNDQLTVADIDQFGKLIRQFFEK